MAEDNAKTATTSGKRMIRVTQTKSAAGRLKRHKACVAGLGLRRIGHTVEVEDTPAVRGMINRVSYMVQVVGEANATMPQSGSRAVVGRK
ncbi:MAG: 50S ribosomal protein L30 [Gammaproteobacteria bacterium]|nr:50S ribosomal protein L30 [Gammaproteobacteria bacterium]MYF13032.1 50S ribosomal protein L30 [Gammaproteobacteria bacterium]MYG12157.1 50S ribosomal protein L30 [Gammaproteobacteria bacterium]MYK27433.1 50S ribosomal protein L30 [Gammaproteobacteria bacterium]